MAPGKRRIAELASSEHSKNLGSTPRTRTLHACEACRAKKSKCDNERPSCGSCISHGVECVYKGVLFIPPYVLRYSLLILDLMLRPRYYWGKNSKKLEAFIVEYGKTLQKLQNTADSSLGPLLTDKAKVPERTYISPAQANLDGTITSMVFQVPKGGFGSLDYFMTLSFVEALLPQGHKHQTFICDNPYEHTEHKRLPNLLSISKTLSYFVSSTPFFNLAPISCFCLLLALALPD